MRISLFSRTRKDLISLEISGHYGKYTIMPKTFREKCADWNKNFPSREPWIYEEYTEEYINSLVLSDKKIILHEDIDYKELEHDFYQIVGRTGKLLGNHPYNFTYEDLEDGWTLVTSESEKILVKLKFPGFHKGYKYIDAMGIDLYHTKLPTMSSIEFLKRIIDQYPQCY